jgi:hypothetical protein
MPMPSSLRPFPICMCSSLSFFFHFPLPLPCSSPVSIKKCLPFHVHAASRPPADQPVSPFLCALLGCCCHICVVKPEEASAASMGYKFCLLIPLRIILIHELMTHHGWVWLMPFGWPAFLFYCVSLKVLSDFCFFWYHTILSQQTNASTQIYQIPQKCAIPIH